MSDTTSTLNTGSRSETPKGLLDRILGISAEVRGGEGLTALLLMVNIFFLLAAYSMLKTIREPLILTTPGGAEVKSYAAAAIAGLFIVLVPLYSAIASRVSRVKLINGVTSFFAACLVAFFVLSGTGVPIGVAFFIWVGIFNLMIIAQLWAFANDVYTLDQGKRLFAIVGFGASLGAIAGSFLTGQLVKSFGPYPFMLGACALLLLCMVLTNVINVRERRAGVKQVPTTDEPAAGATPGASTATSADEPVRGRSGFSLVFRDRYLLLIGLLMLIYNFVNTNGEYILGKMVLGAYVTAHGAAAVSGLDAKKVIGEFYGNFQTMVNVLSALIQIFVVSRVIKYLGVRVALLVLPVVAIIGYASMAFVPILSFIRGAKLAENSLDYSLQNTTRNALYLPTSREAKYKAKQANDTFFVRFGDVLSAGLVFAGTTWFGFASREFALTNVALIAVWLVLAVVIGRLFKGQEAKQATETPSSARAKHRTVTSDSGVPAPAPGMTPAPVVASVASPRSGRPVPAPGLPAGRRDHVQPEQQQQDCDHATKCFLGQAREQASAQHCADNHPDGGDEEKPPQARDLGPLSHQIDRYAGEVHEEGDRGCRGDERLLRHLEPKHRGRADTTLVAHQPTEQSGECACGPCRTPTPANSPDPPRQFREAGQNQEHTEDHAKRVARHPHVEERAGEPADGAHDAESKNDTPIHIPTQNPEALRGADKMWNGNRGHSQLGAHCGGEHWGEHASNAEARYRGDSSGKERSNGEKHAEDHGFRATGGYPFQARYLRRNAPR